jgi:uncharacterized membrane protein YwaF
MFAMLVDVHWCRPLMPFFFGTINMLYTKLVCRSHCREWRCAFALNGHSPRSSLPYDFCPASRISMVVPPGLRCLYVPVAG